MSTVWNILLGAALFPAPVILAWVALKGLKAWTHPIPKPPEHRVRLYREDGGWATDCLCGDVSWVVGTWQPWMVERADRHARTGRWV